MLQMMKVYYWLLLNLLILLNIYIINLMLMLLFILIMLGDMMMDCLYLGL